jgi:hypothetical protein
VIRGCHKSVDRSLEFEVKDTASTVDLYSCDEECLWALEVTVATV